MLLTQYQGELKLSSNPLVITDQFSSKLIGVMTDEDKNLKDVKKAVEEGRPLDSLGPYLKTFQLDVHVKEEILFNDIKLIVPAAFRPPFFTLLHETHPEKFGMKQGGGEYVVVALIPKNLPPRGKIVCAQRIKSGKNLKSFRLE